MRNDSPFKYTIFDYFSLLEDKELRMNAASYSPEIIEARKIITKLKELGRVENLKTFAEKVFVGARVKRLFTTSMEGIPYLMPIDLLLFPIKERKWVRKTTKDIENWWVKPRTILITQSGIPGEVVLTNKHFTGKLVSPNVIRVVPNETGNQLIGFIYAYLKTKIGNAFLTRNKYGMTIKHIEPYHVEEIPIPLLPEDDIRKINTLMMKAWKLKETAQEIEEKAIALLEEKLRRFQNERK